MENRENIISYFNLNDFKLSTNYCIEASAGTGKTYNICGIVEKLVNNGIDLSKILIVTYTEKAAGELKDRIRNRIGNIDDIHISTIHSFCLDTIKEFGLGANLPLNLNVADESFVDDFIERYIREIAYYDNIGSNNYLDKKVNLLKLSKILSEIYNVYYLDKDLNVDPDIIDINNINEDFCKKIEGYICALNNADSVFKLVTDLERDEEGNSISFNHYKVLLKSNNPKAKEFAKAIVTPTVIKDDDGGVSIDYTKGLLNFDGRQFNPKSFKDPLELAAFNYFKTVKELVSHYNPDLIVALRYCNDFYIKLLKEKEKFKVQNFNDMIRNVREGILHYPNLVNSLRNKYQYAIIDEFQDTNQLQFDIFKNIFLCDSHNLIVVGDPKQSIYSFQGADVNVYHKAKEEIVESGGILCSLGRNFRSTSKMVDSCNRLFKEFTFDKIEFNDCMSLPLPGSNDAHEVLYDNKDTKAFWMLEKYVPVDNNESDKNGKEDIVKVKKHFASIICEQIIDCCTLNKNNETKLRIKHKGSEFRNVSFKSTLR